MSPVVSFNHFLDYSFLFLGQSQIHLNSILQESLLINLRYPYILRLFDLPSSKEKVTKAECFMYICVRVLGASIITFSIFINNKRNTLLYYCY